MITLGLHEAGGSKSKRDDFTLPGPVVGPGAKTGPLRIQPHIFPLGRMAFAAAQHVVEKTLLPKGGLLPARLQHRAQGSFQCLHPARECNSAFRQHDKEMRVVGHEHEASDRHPVLDMAAMAEVHKSAEHVVLGEQKDGALRC